MAEIKKRPSLYSPLVLAYIGDGVYELFVRSKVIEENENMPAHKLHKTVIKYVNASAQAKSITEISEYLTDDETAVYKRGRNAKSYTNPKNADIGDYRKATGFEALVGYLYLLGEKERVNEIMGMAYDRAL